MMIFLLIAGTISFVTLLTTVRIWIPRAKSVVAADQDPEWQVLLAKRNEIEGDALMASHTKDLLREEWTSMADAVLSRNRESGSTAALPASLTRTHTWLIAGISGILALGIYSMVGRWDGDALEFGTQAASLPNDMVRPPPPAEGTPHPGSTETLEDRIAKLEAKLKETPDDLDGWVLLARSRGIQRDFAAASVALERALTLSPGHPDLLAELADVLAMTANKSLAGRPSQLIDQALKAEPENRKALSLAATAAMQENDLSKASTYWRRLRATFPENAPDIAQIDAILAEIGGKASPPQQAQKAQPSVAAAIPAATSGASIEGIVELAPQLIADLKKRGLPATAMLFVVAKNPAGPPIPMAVERLPAQPLLEGKSIPFKLDDSQAMSPEMKLSTASVVNVDARVSLSGTAGRQPGDLALTLQGIKVGTNGLRLVIQSALP